MTQKHSADALTVIDLFGGMSRMAEMLDHKHVTTVQGWKVRNRIPPWRHPEIAEAADSAGIGPKVREVLSRLA